MPTGGVAEEVGVAAAAAVTHWVTKTQQVQQIQSAEERLTQVVLAAGSNHPDVKIR